MEDAAIDDWIEVVGQFYADDIDRACKSYMKDQPRRRPTPGDIRARCLTYAKDRIEEYRRSLPPPPEPERKPRVSAEVAERIMQDHGFTSELDRVLNRFPKSATRQEAFGKHEEATSEVHWSHKASPEQLEQLRQARIKAGMIQE